MVDEVVVTAAGVEVVLVVVTSAGWTVTVSVTEAVERVTVMAVVRVTTTTSGITSRFAGTKRSMGEAVISDDAKIRESKVEMSCIFFEYTNQRK